VTQIGHLEKHVQENVTFDAQATWCLYFSPSVGDVGKQPFNLPHLSEDLQRVELALAASVKTGDEYMSSVAGHLLAAGGKRIRPALAIASSAALTSAVTDEAIMGGCSVELVHLGSLYHDDVMDEASTRRGTPSANVRFGNVVAILAGDFLLAKASEIAADLGTEIAGLLARTIGELCEGQVLELQDVWNIDRTVEQYLRSINGKTASLMATATRIGGLVCLNQGLADRSHVDSLTEFGQRIGMVFQVVDDILDLVATDEQLGKPAGNDLVEGIYTLPVIHGLTDARYGEELRSNLGAAIERSDVDRVRKLVRSTAGVDHALTVAREYANQADAALLRLPQNDVTIALRGSGFRIIDSIPA
jgi:heptaprenyl diphosphate synthase